MVANPQIKYLALHHTAVANTGRKQLNAVNNYHKGKWGMKSSRGYYVGYNNFCDVDGTETETRAVGEETIANKGHNCDIESRCDTISYSMAGDFNVDNPTLEQTEKFRAYYHKVKLLYPGIKVIGHRDIQASRTCPGSNINEAYFRSIMGRPNREDAVDREKQRQIAELMNKISKLRTILALLKRLMLLR